MKTHCIDCGKPLPEDHPAAQQYCDECRIKAKEASRIARNARRRSQPKRRTETPKTQRTLSKKDEDYCRKCIFRGSFSAGYLCDYLDKTKQARGCPPGYGCKRRVMIKSGKSKPGMKVCERCGADYQGGPDSHFCRQCRKDLIKENTYSISETKTKKQ